MDSSWVEHLIDSYSSQLLRYLKAHSHSPEDAEDMLQEIFISVYEHCSEFDPEKCNEQAWLYIIAKRKLIDYYRKFKMNDSLDEMEDWQVPGVDDMAKAANVMSARQAVARGLAILDERSKKIVILRHINGLSTEEVAEEMGLSTANVRTILSRALDAMEKAIGEYSFEE